MKIGIGGKMGAGKTTVAKYLVHEYSFRRYALADRIREIANKIRLQQPIEAAKMLQELLGIGLYLEMFRFAMECEGKSDRWILQRLGTDIVRSYDEDAWVRYLLELIGDKPFVVIDDVRFKNELQYLKDRDYVTIWVNSNIRKERLMARDGYVDGLEHSSELQLDESMFDYVIENNKGVEELYSQVDTIIGESRCL